MAGVWDGAVLERVVGESLWDKLAFEESLMMESNRPGKDWSGEWHGRGSQGTKGGPGV